MLASCVLGARLRHGSNFRDVLWGRAVGSYPEPIGRLAQKIPMSLIDKMKLNACYLPISRCHQSMIANTISTATSAVSRSSGAYPVQSEERTVTCDRFSFHQQERRQRIA